ncbi:hypothetical protein ACLOJK_017693 [Asimina triloba]
MGSSDFSCASSVTDEEGTGIKPPNVVARLMGLDPLPAPYVAEQNSTPFFDARSLREACYQKKAPDLCSDYQNVSSKGQISRPDGFPRKEARLQKMPSSPIERFQTETLPPKSAKSLHITQHKLLSPIKNPAFVSTKNANDIMEAAAKIIEPGLQASSKGKRPSVGSTSVPIKIRDLKENMRASQRISNLPEVPRRPVESNAVKCLKGQSMTKSWNGSEDLPSFKISSDTERNQSFDAKSKGKSVSLAIQAKANVLKRETLNSSSSLAMKEENRQKSTEPFKCQQNTVKNNRSKSSVGQKSSSGVLRQNNQKQNFLINKSKSHTKPLASNQSARKSTPEDSSYARGISNKASGNYRDGNKQRVLGVTNLEKDAPSSRTKNIQRKKRAIGESRLGDTVSVYKDDKKIVHSNATISENPELREDDRRNGMDDVVSFTFTSPMRKPMPGSRNPRQMVEKRDKTRTSIMDSSNENKTRELKNAKVSSLGLNVIGGDALSILLEQKLRELASGVESSCYNSDKANVGSSSSSILQDVLSSVNALSIMPEAQDSSKRPYKDKLGSDLSSVCSTTNVQELNMNHKFQGMERMVQHSSGVNIQKQFESQHPSPVSVLEASISNGSINSSESLDCSDRSQTYSSTQSQVTIGSDSSTNIPFVDVDAELSDSASSTFTGTADHAIGHMRKDEKEVEYVKEILHTADFEFMNLPLGRSHDIINPHFFNRLEIQNIGSSNEEENNESRVKRMELFDCVSECMDLKCSRYNCRGYKAWSKGVVVVRKEGLPEEICREILGWRSMEDQTADELVEKDMSSHFGTWLDFEVEAFEIGVEIGRRILSALVAEAIADMLV